MTPSCGADSIGTEERSESAPVRAESQRPGRENSPGPFCAGHWREESKEACSFGGTASLLPSMRNPKGPGGKTLPGLSARGLGRRTKKPARMGQGRRAAFVRAATQRPGREMPSWVLPFLGAGRRRRGSLSVWGGDGGEWSGLFPIRPVSFLTILRSDHEKRNAQRYDRNIERNHDCTFAILTITSKYSTIMARNHRKTDSRKEQLV